MCTFCYAQSCLGETTSFFQKALYKVIVNGEDTNSAKLFLIDNNKSLYIDTATIKSWGLILQKERLIPFEGKKYYNLSYYKGYTY